MKGARTVRQGRVEGGGEEADMALCRRTFGHCQRDQTPYTVTSRTAVACGILPPPTEDDPRQRTN